MRIAWIEDDTHVIESLIYPLEKEGIEVAKFGTVAEAKASLETIIGSDLVLLDMIIPPGPATNANSRYPGRDLLREWRDASVALPPVVALTVVTNPEVEHELRALHVADIIRKPTLPSVLQTRIHEILGVGLDPKLHKF